MTDKKQTKTNQSIPVVILIVALVYIGLNAAIYFYGSTLQNLSPSLTRALSFISLFKPKTATTDTGAPIPTPIATPTPTRLDPNEAGQGVYTVGQGKGHTGPTITEVTFDPLNVNKGQDLTVLVRMKNTSPITSAKAELEMDNHEKASFVLTRVSGTDTDGQWKGTVNVNDSILYTYILTVRAGSANGEADVVVAPRS